MIVEMRSYKIKAGTRAKFVENMRDKLLPEHKRLGIKYAGPFVSPDDETVLFWMRGFADEAAHKAMTAKVYGGDVWRKDCADVLLPILEKYDVTTVEMPDGTVNWS
ncbi:MAG: NIPSNAP family protein [Alphaproteobacteria bacterium]|nr:NIPSNAP family protein [Alphaproteobacteria bacterium]